MTLKQSIYIRTVLKLFSPFGCFAELVETGLWSIWADQHMYTQFLPRPAKSKEWLRSYCLNNLYTVDVRETGMFSNHKLCMYFFHEKCLQLQPNDEPFPFTLSRFDKNIASHYLKKKSNKNNIIRKHNFLTK